MKQIPIVIVFGGSNNSREITSKMVSNMKDHSYYNGSSNCLVEVDIIIKRNEVRESCGSKPSNGVSANWEKY
jgi:hypothetical protein